MSKNPKGPRMWSKLSALFAIVLGVCAIYAVAMLCLYPNAGERGQFGDMFGAVNALFAGCAFGGVIWAITLQNNQLELQREELAQTRQEIKGQKEQLEAQDQTLKKQNFERSFFQLLNFHDNIVNSLHIRGGGSSAGFDGRACFGTLLGGFQNQYKSGAEINDNWEEFFKHVQSFVGHYFRNLYNCVKFVDQDVFLRDFESKKSYTNLIRAQLSSQELGLLFYNCLSHRGSKFKHLVERYSLLKHMDKSHLIKKGHEDLYDKRAFE